MIGTIKSLKKQVNMIIYWKFYCNPAMLYRLPGGIIQLNAPADFVIFDPNEKWTVTDFASKASNSPFKGSELYGKIHYTICGGKIIYRG